MDDNMIKNKYFLIILLIFLLFIIPATSASDNNTDLIEIDAGNTIYDNNLLNERVDNTEDTLSVDKRFPIRYNCSILRETNKRGGAI